MIPPWLRGVPVAMIDVETTGLEPVVDRVIEIAIVVGTYYDDGGLRIVDRWSSVIFPEVPVTEEITKLTGITEDDVFGAPRFAEVATTIHAMANRAKTIQGAYNASFDRRFIACEFARAKVERPELAIPKWAGWESRWLDPYIWGRSFQRFNRGKKKLPDVAARLGIKAPEGLHRAEVDAALALSVLFALADDERFPGGSLADALARQLVVEYEDRADLLGYLYRSGKLQRD